MLGKPTEADCPVTENGVLRVPPRVREHYLTSATGEGECVVQASGRTLHLWFWSDRENVRLDVPMMGFRVGPPLTRSVHRWGVNLNRFRDHPGIAVQDGHVDADITTFEGARPDV